MIFNVFREVVDEPEKACNLSIVLNLITNLLFEGVGVGVGVVLDLLYGFVYDDLDSGVVNEVVWMRDPKLESSNVVGCGWYCNFSFCIICGWVT